MLGRGCWRSWPGQSTNPRPNIYLRQVDLPGLHTKFIEAHRGVLAELLDLALPSRSHKQDKEWARANSPLATDS